jgi:hypothetical protein
LIDRDRRKDNKMTAHTARIPILIAIAFLLAACGIGNTPTPDPATKATQLVQTLDAMATLSAGETAVAQLTQIAAAATPTPISLVPTATYMAVLPTATAVVVPPTAVPPPPTPCNWAQFVSDVTYPDWSSIKPSTPFRKIWRMRNIGACTWTPGYALVFVNGYNMGSTTTPINVTVSPGQTADIAVDLVSPNKNGNYESYYKLRDTNGVLFGIGGAANGPFWLKIKVVSPTTVVYEMVPDASRATWANSSTTITFGDTSNPANGLAYSSANPQIETGSIENESGLIMKPDTAGTVKGNFPAYTVQSGDHFLSVIGCQYGHTACNVKMQLSYSIGGGAATVLASWDEIYDSKVNNVDVDLSSLAGKSVNLVLTVLANGDATDDYAVWLRPRIMR